MIDSKPSHDRPSICTASGIEFWPFAPRTEDVRLGDISIALAKIPRFGGHTIGLEPFSVAQHSVHVFEILADAGASEEILALGLLHDASEAYLGGDIPGPLKRTPILAMYRAAESVLQSVIFEAFGLAAHPEIYAFVKEADRIALYAEQAEQMPYSEWWKKPPYERAASRSLYADPWSPFEAHVEFMSRADELQLSTTGDARWARRGSGAASEKAQPESSDER